MRTFFIAWAIASSAVFIAAAVLKWPSFYAAAIWPLIFAFQTWSNR